MGQNRERYTSGPQSIVSVPVETDVVIYKGDFICLDGGYAVPAGDMNDSGDAAANRETAADNFIGIALTGSESGETDPVTVDTSCEAVFRLELQAEATLSFGSALEIYSDGGACSDYQTVAGTTSKVAVCVEDHQSGVDVRCKLLPQVRLHRANPQT